MRRRDLIATLAAAVTLAQVRARSAGSALPRLALITSSLPLTALAEPGLTPVYRAFFGELRRRGRIEGKTLVVERYSAAGQPQGLQSLANAVVASKPDAITTDSNDLLAAFKTATKDIPIVGAMGDPVLSGLVTSLAHPGGNITGASADAGPGLAAKRLGILHEAFPTLPRFGYLGVPIGWERIEGPDLRRGAQQIGVELVPLLISTTSGEADFRSVLETFARSGGGGIVVGGPIVNFTNRRVIAEIAQSARRPVIYPTRDYADVGALIIYGFSEADVWVRVAAVLADVLDGAKPGDIPIAQPTRFDLIINDRTAKAQGFTIPAALVLRADEVIQ